MGIVVTELFETDVLFFFIDYYYTIRQWLCCIDSRLVGYSTLDSLALT